MIETLGDKTARSTSSFINDFNFRDSQLNTISKMAKTHSVSEIGTPVVYNKEKVEPMRRGGEAASRTSIHTPVEIA